MIGKWHLQSNPTGYDHWDVLPGQGHYYNPEFITPDGTHQIEGYVTDIITDKVISWIDQNHKADQPFMVSYHHKAPHQNWKPAPDHLGMFDEVDIPEPETLLQTGPENYQMKSGRRCCRWRVVREDFCGTNSGNDAHESF